MHYVSEIFKKPRQWGLRGDPLFWDYLRKYYTSTKIPYSAELLKKDINKLFEELTNEKLQNDKNYFVPSFAKKHMGMSTGHLSGEFWIENAIPLLVMRLEKLNSDFSD